MSQQITTISFFRYRGLRNKLWAFGMMQFAHADLQDIPGMTFYKLMGSGRGFGFNPLPDWSIYCLLQVWESEGAAKNFFACAPLMGLFRMRTASHYILYMRNITSKGEWSGRKPFEASAQIEHRDARLAVITRATIRWSKLAKFWSYVPTSQKYLSQAMGLLFTQGIGEVPIVQMATFSLWENKEALFEFAYRGKEHAKAIKMTRELDWYKEELFARFQVIREEKSA